MNRLLADVLFLAADLMTVNALALALACLLWPRLAAAQFDAATVLGSVIDATGAADTVVIRVQ